MSLSVAAVAELKDLKKRRSTRKGATTKLIDHLSEYDINDLGSRGDRLIEASRRRGRP